MRYSVYIAAWASLRPDPPMYRGSLVYGQVSQVALRKPFGV